LHFLIDPNICFYYVSFICVFLYSIQVSFSLCECQTNHHIQGHEDAKQQDEPGDTYMRRVRCVIGCRRCLLGLRQRSTSQPQQRREGKSNDKARCSGIVGDPAQLPLENAQDNGRDTGQQPELYPNCCIVLFGTTTKTIVDEWHERRHQDTTTLNDDAVSRTSNSCVRLPYKAPNRLFPNVIAFKGKADTTSRAGKHTTYQEIALYSHVDVDDAPGWSSTEDTAWWCFHIRLDDCSISCPNADASTTAIQMYMTVQQTTVARNTDTSAFCGCCCFLCVEEEKRKDERNH
jgi:hypothetical protein